MKFPRAMFDGGEPGAPAPAPGAPPAPAWYAGLDAVTIGTLQTKGWDKMEPAAAVAAAVTAHREAEGFIGIPKDQLLRMPKDAADEATASVMWARLGKPADAAGYKFEGVKFADGSDLDQSFADTMRTAALAANLPASAADRMTAAVVKYLDDSSSADGAEKAASLAAAQTALKANWGANFEANMFVAKSTAAKLGATPEQVTALEGVLGYDKVMELFRTIGTKIGEDKFVQNLNPAIPGVMSVEQATARKAELMRDSAWAARYLAGGAPEAREMAALIALIHS